MLRALESVRTTMTVFVDDDVLLPITFLGHILAPFEDPLVGAAGCFATVSRIRNPSLVHMLGAFRLQRRNFDTSSTAHIDGGISTISGRTFTVRSSIVKCRHFAKEFANELFLNRYPLVTADDDKFLTRWVCAHDWKVVVQSSKYAEIETTFEECPRKFSMQCLRWARTRLRGNISTLALESYPWRQPWSLYAIYFRTFTPPAAVMDGTLAYLLYKAIQSNASVETTTIMMVFALWVVFSKTIKLLPHLYRYPLDVRFIPGQVLFAYLHGIVEIYAAVTFNKTGWGTRNLGTHAENLHDNCVRWITKVSKPRVTDVSEEKEK
ncbi:MAG: hypothetical protein M1827_006564 [Pycnora praestabilis]|nr:MAG: hypothetical protein M1827_006564 [Pycnora praestabilis]